MTIPLVGAIVVVCITSYELTNHLLRKMEAKLHERVSASK